MPFYQSNTSGLRKKYMEKISEKNGFRIRFMY